MLPLFLRVMGEDILVEVADDLLACMWHSFAESFSRTMLPLFLRVMGADIGGEVADILRTRFWHTSWQFAFVFERCPDAADGLRICNKLGKVDMFESDGDDT